MLRRLPRFRVLIVLLVLVTVPTAGAPVQAQLRAGAAVADITPENLPLPMVGSFSERIATRAWDPLHARALVLDDGDIRLAIVVIDSCYVPRDVLDDAKQRINAATGIPPSRVLASATHTHTAPAARDRREVRADPVYVERLTSGVVRAVELACRNLEPAEMGWGVMPVPEEVFNRRWFMKEGGIAPDPWGRTADQVRMNPPRNSPLLDRPAGPTDPDVSVVVLRRPDNEEPIAVLANYSLHYVGGIPPGGVSADYFGEFARRLAARLQPEAPEDRPPFVAMLSNGTSGDINNISFRVPRPSAAPFQRMREVAERVSQAAYDVVQQADYRRDVDLAMAETRVRIARREPSTEQVRRSREFLEAADPSNLPPRALPYARWTLDLHENRGEEELILQALRLGDVGIVAIPCEVFVEIGLEIKRRSPLEGTFTMELANGHYGYLPTPRQHAWGGYETWVGTCILEENASEIIKEQLLDLLQQVAR